MDTESLSLVSSEASVSLTPYSAHVRLSTQCSQMPIKDLSDSTRNFLSKSLDPETDHCTDGDFLTMNWRGLAELMNYDTMDIENFDAHHPTMTKTKKILKDFQTRKGATVEVLWNFLVKLQRFDILDGDQFRNKLESDYKQFMKRRQAEKEREAEVRRVAEQSNPVQVPKVSTNFEEPVDYRQLDAETDEFHQMVVDDVNKNEKTMFDAFVSYCHDDFNFVSEMIRMVEKVYHLKLCINARDLLPGASEQFVTARLIADRCRKVILVMSPSFLRSPECEFQVKVALSLSPGAKRKILIPILFRHCKMPLVLQHVCLVDYTKSDLAEWFWGRLAASLRESRGEKVLIPKEDLQNLSSMEYDLDRDYKECTLPDINEVPAYNDTSNANTALAFRRNENIPPHGGPMEHTERYISGGDQQALPKLLRNGNTVNKELDQQTQQTQQLDSRHGLMSHQQMPPPRQQGHPGYPHHHRGGSPMQQQHSIGGPRSMASPPGQTMAVVHRSPPAASQGMSGFHSTHSASPLPPTTNITATSRLRPAYDSREESSTTPAHASAQSWGPGNNGVLPNLSHFEQDSYNHSEYSDIHIGGCTQSTSSSDFEQMAGGNSGGGGQLQPAHMDFDLISLASRDITIHPAVTEDEYYASVSTGYDDYQCALPPMVGTASVCGSMVSNAGYRSSSGSNSSGGLMELSGEDLLPPGHYQLPSEPITSGIGANSSSSSSSGILEQHHHPSPQSKPKKQSSGIHRFFPKGNKKKSSSNKHNN